jgi:hypothetical protein
MIPKMVKHIGQKTDRQLQYQNEDEKDDEQEGNLGYNAIGTH